MNQHMKRLICVLSAACLMMPLSACKGGSEQESEGTESSILTQASENDQSSAEAQDSDRQEDSADSTQPENSLSGGETVSQGEGTAQTTTAQTDTIGTDGTGVTSVTSVTTGQQPGSTAATSLQTPLTSVPPSAPAVETGGEFYAENITAAAGAKHVPVTVSIRDNPGIASFSVRFFYDAALTPAMLSKLDAEFENGTVTAGVTSVCACNQTKRIVGYTAGAGAAELTADGTVFTVYFDVPADAKSGTVYQFTMESKGVVSRAGADLVVGAQPFTLTVK